MLAKSLKFAMVFAVVLTFCGGTAMADNHGRMNHSKTQWNGGHPNQHANPVNHHYAEHHDGDHHHYAYTHRDYDRHYAPRTPHPPVYRPVYRANPLAPRIAFIGPIPVPVPPSPHEVIGFITGRR
jgi:hypothetical protein